MTRTRTAAAMLAFLALAAPAAAQEIVGRTPSMSVNGEGIVMAEPDLAIVSIGVLSRGATAREALDANSRDMEAVVASITGAGVERRDIGTTGFSINPVYENPPEPLPNEARLPPQVVGYEVSNQVTVRIRNLAESGAILDQVVSAGANQVNNIQFDIDDQTTLKEEATRLAIADARRKAEILADAAGVTLVRILAVSVNDYAEPVMFDRAVAMAAPAPPSVPILGGEHTITVNATIEWEIAGGEDGAGK